MTRGEIHRGDSRNSEEFEWLGFVLIRFLCWQSEVASVSMGAGEVLVLFKF
jgi:hypothetical protein